MRSSLHRAALAAIFAAASAAFSGCWYYSAPASSAQGTDCQNTSYGLLTLDTSHENCQPAAAPSPAP